MEHTGPRNDECEDGGECLDCDEKALNRAQDVEEAAEKEKSHGI